MRLLLITQKVDENDSYFSYFPRWIEEFAKNCESVEVIGLSVGKYTLPQNVTVHSLGKESGASRLKYLYRFYKNIFVLRDRYDAVFVHMNPEYVILGGVFWRLMSKKVSLWYLHKAVNLKLRIAEKLAHVIYSASPESFRLTSKKLKIVGHGIDTNVFTPGGSRVPNHVLSVSRMSPSKRIEDIVGTVELAKKVIPDITLEIIGTPSNIVQNKNLPEYYRRASLFINLSTTGSLDKAVLEAMACECPVLTTNEAFRDLGKDVYMDNQEPKALANFLIQRLKQDKPRSYRQWVIENHSLQKLVPKILTGLISKIMKAKYWLIGIIVGAFILRIIGITYGLPLLVVADEPSHLYGSLQMLESKTIVPGLHPTEFLEKLYFPPYLSYIFLIPISLVLAIWYLIAGVSIEVFKNLVVLDPTPLFLTVRFLSAIAGTLTVYFVYKAARNIFKEEKTALLSGAVMALAYLPVNFSHWGRHWSFVLLTFSLVIYFLSRQDLSARYRYLYSSLAIGIGFGINYQAGVAAILVILWFFFIDWHKFSELKKNVWVWEAVALAITLFALVILLYPQNLKVISPGTADAYRGGSPTIWGLLQGYVFYLKHLIWSEPFLLFGSLAGVYFGLRSKYRKYFGSWVAFCLLYVVVFYFAFHLQGRYILMLYPLLATIAGYGLANLPKSVRVILLVGMFVVTARFDILLSRNDTRIESRNWIFENVEEGEKVAVLARLDRLPSTPDAVDLLESMDSSSLRKVDLAEREMRDTDIGKRYHAFNLANVKGGPFFESLPKYLRDNGYKYVIVSPEFAEAHKLDLAELGEVVATFQGYNSLDDINDLTNGFGGGGQYIFGSPRNGPTIYICAL